MNFKINIDNDKTVKQSKYNLQQAIERAWSLRGLTPETQESDDLDSAYRR